MTARLNFLKETCGIGVFTARPGMGKSYALRCFAKSLNPNMYHMEYICLFCVPNMDFGCELSFLSDTFWNAEKISQHLDNPFDVESLVAGIKTLGSLDETT